MLINYIEKALNNMLAKQLEDGTWFVEILGFDGVWGNGKTLEEATQELKEVLEEWVLLHLLKKHPVPFQDLLIEDDHYFFMSRGKFLLHIPDPNSNNISTALAEEIIRLSEEIGKDK